MGRLSKLYFTQLSIPYSSTLCYFNLYHFSFSLSGCFLIVDCLFILAPCNYKVPDLGYFINLYKPTIRMSGHGKFSVFVG